MKERKKVHMLGELFLTVRAANCLNYLILIPCIKTPKDFSDRYTYSDLKKVRNCGEKTCREIANEFQRVGYPLKGALPDYSSNESSAASTFQTNTLPDVIILNGERYRKES